MAGKAGISGFNKFDELIVSFKKNSDGTYTKETKRMTRDRLTGGIKYYRKNNPIIEDGPYCLVNATDGYDEKLEFDDSDGEKAYLYFKKLEAIDEGG
jgi:hypothetical protein